MSRAPGLSGRVFTLGIPALFCYSGILFEYMTASSPRIFPQLRIRTVHFFTISNVARYRALIMPVNSEIRSSGGLGGGRRN